MKIYLSSKADKQLHRLPRQIYQVILNKIEKLERDSFPVGVNKLESRPGWRIRVGDYRILYTVDQKKKELTILSVSHRKDAYRY